jgi:hypothetical protein
MRTQGKKGQRWPTKLGGCGAGTGRAALASFAALAAILPALGGCSSSSWSDHALNAPPPPAPAVSQSYPQQQAYPPQPGASPAAYSPPPANAAGYPPPAVAAAAAPPAAPPPSQGSSFRESYVGFLQMFRDPDPDASEPPQAGVSPTANVYPQQSLSDLFRGSTTSSSAPPPQQGTAMPHPPSTYTPSAQPYTPPPGQQPAYNAPPPPPPPQSYPPQAPQTYAPPPRTSAVPQQPAYSAPPQTYAAPQQQSAYSAPPRYAATAAASPPPAEYNPTSGVYPQQSITDLFRDSTESPANAQPSAAPPAYGAQPRYAASAPAAPPGEYNPTSGVYPRQSITDLFRGSTESPASAQPSAAQQAMPHPPSTYTPSAQPYTPPPGQQAYGQPAGAPQPAPQPPPQAQQAAAGDPSLLPYPKQNIFDIFSGR